MVSFATTVYCFMVLGDIREKLRHERVTKENGVLIKQEKVLENVIKVTRLSHI